MRVEPLPLGGVFALHTEDITDERGSFRRIADIDQLDALGLETRVSQVSSVTNSVRGTVRGLHYQVAPDEEVKTLWCSSGRVFDVLVDVRLDSPTYGQWTSVELSGEEPVALYVPRGIAHGYQTLTDNAALFYLIGTAYVAESARALRWNDATVAVAWPLPVTRISDRDQSASAWPPARS